MSLWKDILGTNEFTLLAGNYLIQWVAPAYAVGRNTTQLHDGSSAVAVGISAAQMTSTGTYAIGVARVTPTSSTTYQIQHRATTTAATHGFGIENNFGTEQYTTVTIYKES